MKVTFQNPLLIKQLREEMRSRKIFFLVPVYIAILSTVSMVAVGSASSATFNPMMMSGNARYTLFAFSIAISILLGLVGLILGASSFTSERERATYELLELTPLSYTDLVLGKFLHAYLIVALILFSSMPVVATLFFMGGINSVDLLLIFFYLSVFFALVIQGAICISIIANRTIIGIILALVSGLIVYIGLAVLGADAFRNVESIGFGIASPWMVIWRQIFSPVPLQLSGVSFPIWIFYFLIYFLLAWLMLSWARNALDTRKLQRNSRARIAGILAINFYLCVGLLCASSKAPISIKQIENLYQVVLLGVTVALPFFAFGTFTDKDRIEFQRRPVLQSLHPRHLFLNHPATGFLFLILMLFAISLTTTISSAVSWNVTSKYFLLICLWILPWFFLFTGLRLAGYGGRAMFVTYLLAIVCMALADSFYQAGKTYGSLYDFLLAPPILIVFYLISIGYFLFAKLRLRSRTAKVS